MKRVVSVPLVSLCLLAMADVSYASMRCGNNLINEGAKKFEVIEKCGEPQDKEVIEPMIGTNNKTPNKSVTAENWVYGPSNGMYRYLKFIDGVLVKIESKRL